MKLNDIQKKLVAAGVKNLQEFGYPDADSENIFSDMIYSKMFLSMLGENKGNGFDKEIQSLIEQVEFCSKEGK